MSPIRKSHTNCKYCQFMYMQSTNVQYNNLPQVYWVWFCYSCTRRSRTWTVSNAKISRKTCKHVDFSCMHCMYSVSYTMQQAFRYKQYLWYLFLSLFFLRQQQQQQQQDINRISTRIVVTSTTGTVMITVPSMAVAIWIMTCKSNAVGT